MILTSRSYARSKQRVRAGFTLIELVITMAILTIIAGVAVPQFSNFSKKAEDSRRIADMVTLEKALESYKADFGRYPAGARSGWSGDAPIYGGYGYGANGYIVGLVPNYMKELPRDPNRENPIGDRGYVYNSNGTDYKLCAHLTPNNFPVDHRFFDPIRPDFAYQISSAGAANW